MFLSFSFDFHWNEMGHFYKSNIAIGTVNSLHY